MTEFQELVKDAPKFASMERGELVAHAYAMYAAGAKADEENAKLRELVRELYEDQCDDCDKWKYRDRMRELGVEVEP